MEIDFYDINFCGDHVVAEYGLFENGNMATITQQISEDELLKFIEENEVDHDGLISPSNLYDYLADNYFEITKKYITQHAN